MIKDKDFSFDNYPKKLVESERDMRYISVESLDIEKIKGIVTNKGIEWGI